MADFQSFDVFPVAQWGHRLISKILRGEFDVLPLPAAVQFDLSGMIVNANDQLVRLLSKYLQGERGVIS